MNTDKMPELGFGMMRLPEKDGAPDLARVCAMTDAYMESGFCYFDTAWPYHGGKSEPVVREAVVARYPRDSFFLATKLPGWELKVPEDRDTIFSRQLERCGTDFFDFYLLHSVEEGSHYEAYESLNCFRWGAQKKAEGRIRNFGFSFHGTPELLEKLLDDHPDVDFVQIQLNYADWKNPLVQSGRLYEILRRRGIPVIVMEPVKGGTLAALPPAAAKILHNADPSASAASWALRFAASQEGVVTVLSGMSSEEQMADNLRTFRNFRPLTEEERAVLRKAAEELNGGVPQIGCTSCRYCCAGCPQVIAIPDVFRALNAARLYPGDRRADDLYRRAVSGPRGTASSCIACRRCENSCPQHLPVVSLLQEAAERFDGSAAL